MIDVILYIGLAVTLIFVLLFWSSIERMWIDG